MATILTEYEVRQMIRTHIGARSLAKAGADMGVSASWLCQVLKGDRRPAGKILDLIGVARNPRAPKKALAFTKLSD